MSFEADFSPFLTGKSQVRSMRYEGRRINFTLGSNNILLRILRDFNFFYNFRRYSNTILNEGHSLVRPNSPIKSPIEQKLYTLSDLVLNWNRNREPNLLEPVSFSSNSRDFKLSEILNFSVFLQVLRTKLL